MKKKSVCKLLFILIFIGISASFAQNSIVLSPNSQDTIVYHPKIYISGESALDAFPNKTGSGTQQDPYKISNFEIDADGSGTSVEIRSIMNRYLILEGISATGSGSNDATNDCGIKIRNCRHVVVQNCEAYSNGGWGIIITISTYCEILDSEFSDNEWSSIAVDDSSYVEVRDNDVHTGNGHWGIGVSGSTNTLVTGNSLHSPDYPCHGIDLYYSSGNIISENTVVGYGKGVYLHGESSNNDILNNKISQCEYGVYLEEQSNNNLIKNNKFRYNDEDFFETGSSGNRVINTTVIIVWSTVGAIVAAMVVLGSIILPKVYKKRAPIREERKAERDRILEEMRQKQIEEQKRQLEEERLDETRKTQDLAKKLEEMKIKELICASCGKILPEQNLKFCVFCGKPHTKVGDHPPIVKKAELIDIKGAQVDPQDSTILRKEGICPHCGKVLMDPNLKFCVYCGITL